MENGRQTNLSIIILTKNEATMIGDCLRSVKSLLSKEVIVVDDNSSDTTGEIAKQNGATVLLHTKKDFAEARNFGLSKVTSEWVLYVDADERISPELSQEILDCISHTHNVAFEIPRQNFYLGKKWPYEEKLTRLFKKTSLSGWYGEVHESPKVSGEIGKLTHPLIHYTHRNLSEMVENTIIWSKIEAELRLKAHHPPVSWWRIPRVMIPVFFAYYISQGGWKVGTVGLIESIYQAFSIFITYARLWEMQNSTKFKVHSS